MTARKPVSAIALGLSSAVVFGFGAGQASADVNQVVQQRLISLQSDPTPSPVLALSSILSKADAGALLKKLQYASQVKLTQLLRKLPDLAKFEQTKLADLAKTDPAKAQTVIAAALANVPNLSRAEATMSAALLAAVMSKSPDLSKLGLSSLPDLATLDEPKAHAALDAIVAKLPDASSLTKDDAAKILQEIQKIDLSKIAGVTGGLDLSKLTGLAGLDLAKAQSLANSIVAQAPDLSKDSVAQVLVGLGKADLSKIASPSGVDPSKANGLSGLSQEQIASIADALAASAQQPAQPSLSEADVTAAEDALTKIDPSSLPDLSKVDLSKLGAPPA